MLVLPRDTDRGGILLTPLGEPNVPLPDPIPAAVRRGPKARVADDDYLLYAGPVEAATAVAAISDMDETPSLWWPADRAWCVATDQDLAWTYVGGPARLIDDVIRDPRIEALPANPGDALTLVEEWPSTPRSSDPPDSVAERCALAPRATTASAVAAGLTSATAATKNSAMTSLFTSPSK